MGSFKCLNVYNTESAVMDTMPLQGGAGGQAAGLG